MGPVGRAFQRSCRQPGFLLIPLLFCLPTHPPPPLPFIFFLFYLFWLHWVFVAARGLLSSCSEQELLSVVVLRLLMLLSTGSRAGSSAAVAHELSHSWACGIFLDQGSNPCRLYWQADPHPLYYQRSPCPFLEEV